MTDTTIKTKAKGRPRDEAVKRRVQDAAVQLLIEGGFPSLTCDAIAQRAATSKATIYRWWPNKVHVIVDAFIDSIAPAMPISPADTFEEFLRMQIPQFIKALQGRNGLLLAAMIATAQVVPEVHDAYLEHWIKPRRETLRKLFRHYQKTGSLTTAADPDMLIDIIYGPLQMLLLVQPERLKTSYATHYLQTLLEGLLA